MLVFYAGCICVLSVLIRSHRSRSFVRVAQVAHTAVLTATLKGLGGYIVMRLITLDLAHALRW